MNDDDKTPEGKSNFPAGYRTVNESTTAVFDGVARPITVKDIIDESNRNYQLGLSHGLEASAAEIESLRNQIKQLEKEIQRLT